MQVVVHLGRIFGFAGAASGVSSADGGDHELGELWRASASRGPVAAAISPGRDAPHGGRHHFTDEGGRTRRNAPALVPSSISSRTRCAAVSVFCS